MSATATADKLAAKLAALNAANVPTNGATMTDIAADVAATSTTRQKSKSGQKSGRANGKPAVGTLHTMTVDGFELTFATGDVSADALRANVSRATTNPWYPVAEWLAAQVPGFLTIRKVEGSDVKSPLSRMWSAIMRAQKLDVKNARKLDARSGTDKGVWYFIRRP